MYNGSGSPTPEYLFCYCFLQGISSGADYYTIMKNNGFNSSQPISTNTSYTNSFTLTDNIYVGQTDTYYLGVYQQNSIGVSAGCFLSATLVLQ
jgi:hypothetical protein